MSAAEYTVLMSLYQAAFKVRHECPYRTLSERYAEVTIREWFMNDHQILEVCVPSSPSADLTEAIGALGPVLHESSDDSDLYAVVRSSLCSIDDSLIPYFEAHNCLYLPPTIYRDGWEHYAVTAFEDRDVRALLDELDDERDIEVLSRKSVDVQRVPHTLFTSMDCIFDGLTGRQLEALRVALDNGYFSQPRGASVAELAEQTELARSTFEEHLRKAQNTLIGNTENHLRLVSETDTLESLGDPRGAVGP